MDSATTAVLIAGQRVERQRVDLVANNLANVATDGFRAQRPVTSEHVSAPDGPSRGPSVSMPRLASAMMETTPGETRTTGRPLDLAIEGEGFFQLVTPGGERVLTRAGRFGLDADGRIVAPDGARLLDEGGGAIALDTTGGEITVAPDGSVLVGERAAGRVGLFETAGALERRPGGRFAAAGAVDPVEAPRMRQGAVEASNVDAVAEVAAMIEASRRYEALQNLTERDDQRIRNAVETLSRST